MAPWGYLTTLVWGVLAFVLAQVAGALVLYWWYGSNLQDLLELLRSRPYDGVALVLGTFATNFVEVAVLAGFAALKRWNPAEYLGLVPWRTADLKLALSALAIFLLAGDAALYLAGQDLVPPFQIKAYETARESGWLPVLAIATIIVAPAGEELFFRGFLFRGWVRSSRYAWIGIVVISIIFATLHFQYDLFGRFQVLAIGLLLGWLRYRSGSTALTILCHGLFNLESSLETIIKVHWFP